MLKETKKLYEDDLRRILLEELYDIKGSLEVGAEVPIPYKHIYLPGNPPKLEVWCFKQDIVFYKVLFDKKVSYKDAKINSKGKEIIDIILEKDSAQNTQHIGIPYVIIETKREQPNTHEILTYSNKIEMIKTIFPYCKFVFLIFAKISPRTYRHGLYFDEIVYLDINNSVLVDNFKKLVKKLLKKTREEIGRL